MKDFKQMWYHFDTNASVSVRERFVSSQRKYLAAVCNMAPQVVASHAICSSAGDAKSDDPGGGRQPRKD